MHNQVPTRSRTWIPSPAEKSIRTLNYSGWLDSPPGSYFHLFWFVESWLPGARSPQECSGRFSAAPQRHTNGPVRRNAKTDSRAFPGRAGSTQHTTRWQGLLGLCHCVSTGIHQPAVWQSDTWSLAASPLSPPLDISADWVPGSLIHFSNMDRSVRYSASEERDKKDPYVS